MTRTLKDQPPEVTPNPKEEALLHLIDDIPKYGHAPSESRLHMMTAVSDHLRKAMLTAEARAHLAKHATGDLECFIEGTSLSDFWDRFYRGSPGKDLSEVIEEIREAPASGLATEPPEGSPSPEEWRAIVDERLAVAAVLEEARSIALSGENEGGDGE